MCVVVGMGLALNGGVSLLGRVAGPTCDNLLEVQLVMADGSVVTASKDGDPELFWAVRGAGKVWGLPLLRPAGSTAKCRPGLGAACPALAASACCSACCMLCCAIALLHAVLAAPLTLPSCALQVLCWVWPPRLSSSCMTRAMLRYAALTTPLPPRVLQAPRGHQAQF